MPILPTPSSPFRWASEVESKSVNWLWRPYLPRGFVTLLAGPKWAGKTWCNLAIIAALTRGKGLPGVESDFEPAHCLYLSAEDPTEYVLSPRLETLGADRSRIKIGYLATGMDKVIVQLRTEFAKQPFAYVGIDPLMSFIPPKKHSIASEDMRSVLDPLANLAHEHQCVVVVTTHLAKQAYTEAIDRISGSGQITAAARSILLADKDPDNPDDEVRRVLVHAGTNLDRPGRAWGYELPYDDSPFCWITDSSIVAVTADRLFGLRHEDAADDLTGSSAAAYELLTEMCIDWRASAEIIIESQARGISKRTIQRVAGRFCLRRRLGVGKSGKGQQRVEWKLRVAPSQDGQ